MDTKGGNKQVLTEHLSKLGTVKELAQIIQEHKIEEVIIAIETSEHNRLRDILNILFDFGDQVLVKIIPDMYDILLGSVKMNHVYGAVLIETRQEHAALAALYQAYWMLWPVSWLHSKHCHHWILYVAFRVNYPHPDQSFSDRNDLDSRKPFTILEIRTQCMSMPKTWASTIMRETQDGPFGAIMEMAIG
ncbi:MAG: hypothetical protein R2778_09995 [Saprospiraceae bacterium]